jgi:hypothetical protein
LKSNYQQINPHSTKEECDILLNNGLIYGCGKTFTINLNSEINETTVNVNVNVNQVNNEVNNEKY